MRRDREITFHAKTWIVTAQVLVTGFFLILGPMFYFEVAKNARGESVPEAGLALMIAGAVLLQFFSCSRSAACRYREDTRYFGSLLILLSLGPLATSR
jgi:hypothetical protein